MAAKNVGAITSGALLPAPKRSSCVDDESEVMCKNWLTSDIIPRGWSGRSLSVRRTSSCSEVRDEAFGSFYFLNNTNTFYGGRRFT